MNLNPNASHHSFKPPVPGLNIFLCFISFPHLQSFVITCLRTLTPVGNNAFPATPNPIGLGTLANNPLANLGAGGAAFNFNNQVNNGQANPVISGGAAVLGSGLNIFLCFISFPCNHSSLLAHVHSLL